MGQRAAAPHGVMESGGSYNLHSAIPAAGAGLALPLLEQAARTIALDSTDQPLVIADYGSSQGKNSLPPLRAAIRTLRGRVGPARPIIVVHVDQPANDFNTLFEVLHADPERYSLDDPNVYPSAIGRSFYENVFPKAHVHLGWSSYAAVWLSRNPARIPGHFVPRVATGTVREAFERQAAKDWKAFLSLRAVELRPGGRLVVVLPGMDDEGVSGLEPVFRHANEALAQLVTEGAITADERARMVVGSYPRRRSELLAPFTENQFHGLTLEHYELLTLPDAAWADYERDSNKEALATRHARFFRSIFAPSLAAAIADERKRSAFPDLLQKKLVQRLSDLPTPFHSFVQTIVLAKQGPAHDSAHSQ
jgi:hypothetical protein